MITNKKAGEQISELVDGEVDEASIDAALAALRNTRSREDWEIYHRIGDALRSEELANPLSEGFAARMAARLEAEAPHVAVAAPSLAPASHDAIGADGLMAALRRYLVPGAAGAAAVAIAVTLAPLWVSEKPVSSHEMAAAANLPIAQVSPAALPPSKVGNTPATFVAESQTSVSESDIVRDPRIDQYLMAHQRFSPTAYSSSQFARSATFAAETDK